MDLRSYIRLLLRRWPVFVVVTVVVGALVGGASFLIPPQYESAARVVFSPELTGDVTPEQRSVATTYVSSRMKTYAQAVTTTSVLGPVITALDLDTTVSNLSDEIVVTIPSDTTVMEIAVTFDTADGVAEIANAIAARMPQEVATMEGAVSLATSPVSVGVLEEAAPPESRTSPNIKLNLVIAAIIALLVGVFAAVIVDNFDTRVRRGKDVAALGIAYLGGVTTIRGVAAREMVQYGQQSPERVALYRRIGIDLLFAADETPTHLLFTSTRAGSGKTTVAANVAGALAEAGNRVVYIDSDVRGGRLSAQIGVPQSRGITDIVAGRVGLDDAIFFWKAGDFTIIPCGASSLDISEMLAGEKFAEVLQELGELFDVVIVDAPPMTNASEAARFSQNIPNVVVVAEASETRRADLVRAAGSLRQAGAGLLGVVLTHVAAREMTGDSAEAAEVVPEGTTEIE